MTQVSRRDFVTKAAATTGKLISLAQAGLLAPAPSVMAGFRDHVTPYSLGLPVNVRDGGLKSDLSSLFGFSPAALPAVPPAAHAAAPPPVLPTVCVLRLGRSGGAVPRGRVGGFTVARAEGVTGGRAGGVTP